MGLFKRSDKPVAPSTPEPIVDLRERTPVIRWGWPAPCPDCGLPGYLDSIDAVNRIMYQHCPNCYAKWSIAESDIVAAEEARLGDLGRSIRAQ